MQVRFGARIPAPTFRAIGFNEQIGTFFQPDFWGRRTCPPRTAHQVRVLPRQRGGEPYRHLSALRRTHHATVYSQTKIDV
jgi:hypothetical protein